MGGQNPIDYDNGQNQSDTGNVEIFELLHPLQRHVKERDDIGISAQINEQRGREFDPQGAIGQINHFIDQNLNDGSKGQGHHRKIRACDPQSRQSQQQPKKGCDDDRQRQRRPKSEIKVKCQHTGGVSPDAQQGGVPHRHLARIAKHHIQTKGEN